MLSDSQIFDPKLKDAYQYYTLGGNNSQETLQQLLKEKSYLTEDKNYTHCLCSVYNPLPTHLSLHLASKHNRATSFSHSMSTWDKVCNSIIMLGSDPSLHNYKVYVCGYSMSRDK